ncbi:PREDICTED: trafficking protein particle complex subunit 11 [Rhagoletis zephyria]|uniref:trafficking protein particle complex subunit 11 n=1 Tax=Rhagoletis zephyria TaxID=28612 RepID=UPI0008116F6E|nr:PREDICTED: trafficking protein particle complex subunit 11 [Rhagoletis zephyria]
MSFDSSVLPSELLVAPQPLIGFCGLDTTHNLVHKSIWDAFSTNKKADRASVQFKILPPAYEFPVAKPKRASYEWYQPKGVLKRNWMLKHLHVLPAVVVLFQDMEWNDPQWSEKQVQCASTIQSLKIALQERNTRLCLVLLQKSSPLPPGEDLLASERAASLTTACSINIKMLFILPHTEHLMGYTLRLESAFLDMAQSYYALMSKRIRAHRDQLTAAHTTLKIRHQFKLGFVAEIRQDFSTALKHFTQAYATLDEIRITDANCLEMKTIAGFLNYKLCRLMFKLKVPRDAINHFISHIEKYKNRIGFKDLIFEHYAWLSTQHSVFAELFCEAIKNGLPALQTQNPGIYYNKAAEYTMKRKESFLQSNAILLSPTDPTSPNSMQNNNSVALYTEFFGIRAVKTGDPVSEQQINMLIRENEKSFNHSNAIINLLSLARAQFKIYKCPRFRNKLAIDMAEEYYKSGDHANALTLYSVMLTDYRREQWSSIFSDVLLKTLRCAFLSASITDFISCSIEALSLRVRCEQKDRIIVLENLWKVFKGAAPISHGQSAPEIIERWDSAFVAIKSPITIDLDKLTKLIKMYASFEHLELKNDETINVYLIIKLLTDVPIKIRHCAIVLTDGTNFYKLPASMCKSFQCLLEVQETQKNSKPPGGTLLHFDPELKLEPHLYYQLGFSTDACQFLENTQLRVARIEAQMGSDKLAVQFTKSAVFSRNAFRHYSRGKDLDDNIKINPLCYITPTFHLNTQCNLDKETQMLVNEYYPITTTINNPYNVFLQNVSLNISVPNNLRNQVFLTTDLSPGRQKLHSQIQIDTGELSMQSSNSVLFYVFSLVETPIVLEQKTSYVIDIQRPKVATTMTVIDGGTAGSTDNSPENVRNFVSPTDIRPTTVSPAVHIEFIDESRLRKTREDTISIKCDLDFRFSARFYTLSKRPLTKVYRGENFLLRANMEVRSPVDIDILETYFICDHNLVQSTYTFKRKKFTQTYRSHDKLEDVIVLRTNAATSDWTTAKDFDRTKNGDLQNELFSRSRRARKLSSAKNISREAVVGETTDACANAHMNKHLMGKIPNNLTIINNISGSVNSLLLGTNSNSSMSVSATSFDEKLTLGDVADADSTSAMVTASAAASSAAAARASNTRVVFNKAIEAIQATGHCRGFFKRIATAEPEMQVAATQQQPNFGVYCIRWRRTGTKDENESKFLIHGLEIEEPPLNIYCTIEEKMFVKMPMTYKVVLHNPTSNVLHLVATLSISIADNFICSGHKQLDISIYAYSEKQLVYNLYPLCVGWVNLPELTLEYNTKGDPGKDDTHNNALAELVQRSIPKKVFVLPPLKQQIK